MRIGYPCLNWRLPQRPNRTFRLASFSVERFDETVAGNLAATAAILKWNRRHGFGYFRLSSELVPFASHPVCRCDWLATHAAAIAALGRLARDGAMRITMHPAQFVLLNAPDDEVLAASIAELDWHARLLDAMGLDLTARIQIHVGGVYGDPAASRSRFAERFERLPAHIARRLTIENDDRRYDLTDCLWLHHRTGIPVLFDWFHHRLLGDGSSLRDALAATAATWSSANGPPLVDYSSQAPGARRGTHAETIDAADFVAFLEGSRPHEFDVMLEIRDKEASALRARELATGDPRLVIPPTGRRQGPAAAGD